MTDKIHGNIGRISCNRKYRDPVQHAQYVAFRVHRNQARFRKEGHDLSFDDWQDFWNTDNRWLCKGRKAGSINMKRIISDLPWSKDNIYPRQKITCED